MLEIIEHSTERGCTWTLQDGDAVFKSSGDIDLILDTYNELVLRMRERAARLFGADIAWMDGLPYTENPTAPELR